MQQNRSNGSFAAFTRDLANNRQYCQAEGKAEERQNTKECQSLLYRTLDDPIALLTAALFIVTFGLFLYAVRQASAAREAAVAAGEGVRVTERSAALAQRAWIQVAAKIAGPLRVNGEGIRITLDLTMLNVGLTPALAVDWHVRAFLKTQKAHNAAVEQRKLASGMGAASSPAHGGLVFPSYGFVQRIDTGVAADEVSAVLAEHPDYPLVRMCIVGAVSYRLSFKDEMHQTGFVYEVRIKDDAHELPGWQIDTAGGDIPADRVLLHTSHDGMPYID